MAHSLAGAGTLSRGRVALGLVAALALLAGCGSTAWPLADAGSEGTLADLAAREASAADGAGAPALYLQLEAGLPAWLGPRLRELLGGASALPLVEVPPTAPLPSMAAGSLALVLGQNAGAAPLVPAADPELAALAPDGFLLRSEEVGGALRLVGVGKASPDHYGTKTNRGTLYAAYAALEELGFAFLHPLAPVRPAALRRPAQPLRVAASPRWRVRGVHLHTMHPLELTELLNGWGPAGPSDQAGFDQGLAEWRRVCEWLLANRQNLVEWVLLAAPEWSAFAESPLRQQRLGQLVAIAHEHGLAVGVDAAIVLQQQHAFRLITQQGTLAEETQQLQNRVDYLLGAGFDLISTENATSEFTAGDDQRMLAWIDALATYATQKGKHSHIKIHCSQGLTAPSFKDPKSGAPLNFNFLPHYAVPEMGVLPHTVQHYSLDDPAPTYRNTDFGFVRDFLRQEAGRRTVLWHPETAYWVSFDVDVPLFLPVYAERRLHDLRLIAADEDAGLVGEGPHAGARIDGQVFFSSGWEWGYWLHDVVAARAAYDPQPAAKSDADALRALLGPLLRPLGGAAAVEQLVAAADEQHRLLILGEVGGVAPKEIAQRSGQAYLQGWESFDDLGMLIEGVPGLPKLQTQPDKLGLVTMRNPLHSGPSYSKEVRPLLAAMASTFAARAQTLAALSAEPEGRELQGELAAVARMTALRARQVLGLYDYVDGLDLLGQPGAAAKQSLADARAALDEAALLVAQREASYRVPAARIAAWRPGPTAYPFGYLWTVRRLHYWWRDEGKAVQAPASPCYLNVMSPAGIAFGEGFWVDNAALIQKVLTAVGLGSLVGECLVGPAQEPTYPPAGLR